MPDDDDESTSRPGARERESVSAANRLEPGPGGSPGVNRLAALAAQLLQTTSAIVSLTGDSANGPTGRVAGGFGTTLWDTPTVLCSVVAREERPLNVTDTRADPRVAARLADLPDAVGSYLGVPMRADNGMVVGALCVFDPRPRIWSQDNVRVLEQLAAAAATELELTALTREYEFDRARWDQAIAAAGIGNFDWDLRTGRLLWDQPLIELFGYEGDDRFNESIEAFTGRLHPDDVAHVNLTLQRAIEAVGPFEFEYRVMLPGGLVRIVQARGQATGSGGVADRVLGSAWDVSDTRGAEDRAANIVEGMPVGYVSLSADLTVTAINTAAEQLLHVHRLDLGDKTLWQIVPEAVAATLAEHCRAVRESQYGIEVELYFDDPISAWLETRIWPEPTGTAIYLADVTERREAEELAERIAEYDRTTALALQDAMLTELPQPEHLQIAARYRAAAARNKVGGDWYDAVVQSGGATTVMVGDVTGHDIQAAAIMGQLRSMLRVLVWQGDDRPETVLDLLDKAIAELYGHVFSTAVVARVEQSPEQVALGQRTLRWCAAGHPPPLLISPDGDAAVLATHGLMLGVRAGDPREEFTTDLTEGATLLLYTDGLVESRDASLDDGILRLQTAARRHHALGLDDFLDAVLADTVVQNETNDDVVLLALRVRPA